MQKKPTSNISQCTVVAPLRLVALAFKNECCMLLLNVGLHGHTAAGMYSKLLYVLQCRLNFRIAASTAPTLRVEYGNLSRC